MNEDNSTTTTRHGLHKLIHKHRHHDSRIEGGTGIGNVPSTDTPTTAREGETRAPSIITTSSSSSLSIHSQNQIHQTNQERQDKHTTSTEIKHQQQQSRTEALSHSTAVRRLMQELRALRANPIAYVKAEPNSSNLFFWDAWIQGAPDTPYYGGLFHLTMAFPSDYPFRPPIVKFETRVYHPNISNNGAICVDLLKQGVWSPALSIQALLLALLSLLATPNPDDPLRPDAAILLKTDLDHYNSKVKSYVRKYAKPIKK